MGNRRSEEAISRIVIFGEDFAPQLIEYFEKDKKITIIKDNDNAIIKLKNAEIQAIVNLP